MSTIITIDAVNRSRSPRTLARMATACCDAAARASRLAAMHAESGDRALAADAATDAEDQRALAYAAADRADALAADVTNARHGGRAWHEAARLADYNAARTREFSERAAQLAGMVDTLHAA